MSLDLHAVKEAIESRRDLPSFTYYTMTITLL
jgi:hypothetical protein